MILVCCLLMDYFAITSRKCTSFRLFFLLYPISQSVLSSHAMLLRTIYLRTYFTKRNFLNNQESLSLDVNVSFSLLQERFGNSSARKIAATRSSKTRNNRRDFSSLIFHDSTKNDTLYDVDIQVQKEKEIKPNLDSFLRKTNQKFHCLNTMLD